MTEYAVYHRKDSNSHSTYLGPIHGATAKEAFRAAVKRYMTRTLYTHCVSFYVSNKDLDRHDWEHSYGYSIDHEDREHIKMAISAKWALDDISDENWEE